MLMRATALILTCLLSCLTGMLYAQDSTAVDGVIVDFPGRFISKIKAKSESLTKKIDRQTQHYLTKLAKQEAAFNRKLLAADPATAKALLATNQEQQYSQWLQKIHTGGVNSAQRIPTGEYYPYVDSLQTSMLFLQQHDNLINQSRMTATDLKLSLDKLHEVQTKMHQADQVNQFLQQRKELLKQYISKYTHVPPGLMNSYNNYKKQLVYYNQQVDEYKAMLNNPDKMVRTVLQLLNEIPAFDDFVKNNSILAGLFHMPGTYSASQINQGMPTRDQVVMAFQNQAGVSGPNISSVIQQNVQSAQGQAAQLTDRLAGLKSSGKDLDMPDFSINSQRSKSFFKRMEYGFDLQTVQSSYFFPTTSDIALSLGYKVDDGKKIGIGLSYKAGWGKNIGHIKISAQGIGFRSYMDVKIKKTLYISGGFEYNYQRPFNSLYEIKNLTSWQQSGLVGLSKIIPLKGKFLKATKLQMLWDFLSYEQIPKTQAFKFRAGYNF